ncbi:energy-coupling factor transport system ATP-binding protein [Salinibacillus kushneri]|uniref:Energy-coupling factor transport system ATP-binding protein n=1 Tax=Salinibacillus kushneri TaxID=237682 RepID=A0A1I0IVV3_9BACI|nr:energy-coupling factor ABC transporter ATP-binding protein [Salinibacillus kushneri]SEU01482.1 energy-coupling factor transport system ATP-binding protein [Salinibacillus kushneri]
MSQPNDISFQNISFQYPQGDEWALKDVSFHIEENEWVAIIGHNGSGKSTIAKLMNGLLTPQSGRIHIKGLEVNEENIWEVRKKVGMVFQNPDNQFVGTTVIDDIAFGLENHGVQRDEMLKRMKYSLEAVKMEGYENHEPHNLSGGQKQRVAIASVLAIEPDIIILDEATAMLDPIGRNSIMETVDHVRSERDVSVVTITHDLNEVLFADRVIVMNDGEVWKEGTPREIFNLHKELGEIGLDTPFVTQLSNSLKSEGIVLNQEPLTHKELMDELWTFYSRT